MRWEVVTPVSSRYFVAARGAIAVPSCAGAGTACAVPGGVLFAFIIAARIGIYPLSISRMTGSFCRWRRCNSDISKGRTEAYLQDRWWRAAVARGCPVGLADGAAAACRRAGGAGGSHSGLGCAATTTTTTACGKVAPAGSAASARAACRTCGSRACGASDPATLAGRRQRAAGAQRPDRHQRPATSAAAGGGRAGGSTAQAGAALQQCCIPAQPAAGISADESAQGRAGQGGGGGVDRR